MKNLSQLMKQAQQMQAKMQEMQQKLEAMTVEGAAGGGLIKITMTCKGEVTALKIDPSLVNKDEVEILEDLITAAINDAKFKANKLMEEEMSKLTGGMSLPGGMKLPF
jgi:DNA-binding YbaB/EbfC family protein